MLTLSNDHARFSNSRANFRIHRSAGKFKIVIQRSMVSDLERDKKVSDLGKHFFFCFPF